MSDNVQETNDTAQAAAEAAANAVANTPTPANMPQQANTATQGEPNTIDSLPDWVQAHIKELREENAKHRNKAKHAADEAAQREQAQAKAQQDEMVAKIAEALGIKDPDDPQALLDAANEKNTEQQKRIDELVSTLNDYKRRDAVKDAVGDRKVNTKLLNALLALDNDYTTVDPNSDGYADQVSEAVNKVIDANPEIVQATRGQSGIDPTNTKTDQPITREDLKTMSPEDINQALREGRLDHLVKG